MYYNIKEKYFKNTDLLYEEIPENFIKVFTKDRIIWDQDGNKRFCSKQCPTPDGFYEKNPFEEYKIYDTISRRISIKSYKDTVETEITLSIPNGGRTKFYCVDLDSNVYLNEEFINQYGIPINCSKL